MKMIIGTNLKKKCIPIDFYLFYKKSQWNFIIGITIITMVTKKCNDSKFRHNCRFLSWINGCKIEEKIHNSRHIHNDIVLFFT